MELEKSVKVYKIVDIVDGKLKTLFHGINGSRVLTTRKWLKAVCKRVRDGTSKTYYMSGWHVFENLGDTQKYLKMFKNQDTKAIVVGRARNLRPKEHSPSPVLLADHLYIERVVWRACDHTEESSVTAP